MKKSTKRAIGALVLLAILAWQYAIPLENRQKAADHRVLDGRMLR